MNAGELRVVVDVDTHGALDSGRIGILRRTVALWLLAAAQWLLRSRIDITMRGAGSVIE